MRTLRLLLLAFLFTVGTALPGLAQAPDRPTVTAPAWVLYDASSGQTLAEADADTRRPMASTTKMMTALVALESSELTEVVAISEAAAAIGGAGIGYAAGEAVLLEDLVAALLLQSANDSAIAIAEHVGGNEPVFVGMMNERARALGLTNTSFANAHGLDSPNHFSSANDLLRLALAGMENPDFARMVAEPQITLGDAPDGSERVAENRNELVPEFEGIIGVKTGFTDDAGLVLVAAAERDGRTLYAVVMDSEDHFADAAALLEYGFSSFALYPLLQVEGLSTSTAVEVSERRYEGALTVTTTAALTEPVGVEVVGPSAGTVGQDPPPGWLEAMGWPLRYWDRLWTDE